MNMRLFGQVPEGDVYEVTLENRRGLKASVLTLGATLRSLQVPDADGELRDVVLGYDTAGEYWQGDCFLGATVGRFANRIGGAAFALDGKEYRLVPNEGKNQLHGGPEGFHRRLWTPIVKSGTEALFRLTSPDGDMGFPGQAEAEVCYQLEGNALRISYRVSCTEATPVSLTNHSYFNLAGHAAGPVDDHRLMLRADAYTPSDEEMIPTGEIRPAEGTPLDLREPVRLGSLWDLPELARTRGLDHNFVLHGGEGPAAVLTDPEGRLSLEVYTDRPAIQVYTAGFLKEGPGKDGAHYGPHHAVCLETQAFPDAVNRPEFPSCILRPGGTWESETVYRFEGAGIAKGRRAQMIYL